MNRFLGLFLCVGLLLAGTAAVHGSPPGAEKVSYEMTAERGADGFLSPEVIVKFEAASDRAMHRALAATSVERAGAMENATFSRLLADLRANDGENKRIDRPIDRGAAHRWRSCLKAPTSTGHKIYRPGWRRKVCVG